jgi:type II secretory pathway pseudopilin PulG
MALAKFRFSPDGGRHGEAGFSLVETLVATTMLALALTALAELLVISVRNNAVAKNGTFTSILASQKMEQLRGLTYGFDVLGLPISDTTTDTPKCGGRDRRTGLAHRRATRCARHRQVNKHYQISTTSSTVARWFPITPRHRRWMVEPLPTNPNNTIIIRCSCAPARSRRRNLGSVSGRRKKRDDHQKAGKHATQRSQAGFADRNAGRDRHHGDHHGGDLLADEPGAGHVRGPARSDGHAADTHSVDALRDLMMAGASVFGLDDRRSATISRRSFRTGSATRRRILRAATSPIGSR